LETRDHIFRQRPAALRVPFGILLLRAGLMRRRVVGDDQCVLALFVFEEIQQAVLFHQSRHKIEIRFPILDAVVARFEAALQLQLIIGESQVFKDLLDDVRDGFLLKDSTVRGPREEPGPGHHGGPIVRQPPVASGLH
jgi:hypothetical protein